MVITITNVKFSSQLCLRNTSNKFDRTVVEVSLQENVYDFSVDYDAIDKSDTLHIFRYLIVKNNIK